MTSLRAIARLPVCILASSLASSAAAQCPSDDWTVYSATGDVVEVAIDGSRAWIAAVGGVIAIDLSTIRDERPAQFRLTDTEGLVSPEVTCLTIDAFGNIWVGTRDDGVSVFDASGNHIENLFAFDDLLYSDKVIAVDALGQLDDEGEGPFDRVAISGADSYNPSNGQPEGGGFLIVRIRRDGNGWAFAREGFAATLQKSQELLAEPEQVWIGTGGQGLWRRDNASGDRELVLSVNQGGLINDNVKKLLRAPVAGHSGPDPLWIGTALGLQVWDGTTLSLVLQFAGKNILDLYRTGSEMHVLAETPPELWRMDLTLPLDTPALRIPRSDCSGDTLYTPREVAVGADGQVVLGTRIRSFFVRDGFDWICPPPLGPHWPRCADLDHGTDGTLYFGTGDQNRQGTPNGVGVFDGVDWSSITTASHPNLLDNNVTEIEDWPDGTMWFGTRLSANVGGVNRYDPATDAVTQYQPAAPQGRRTLGRNVWSMATDALDNLWICYGQEGGGLSAIEWPSELITNFPFDTMFDNATTALRDISFDTYGRVWVTTQSSGTAAIGKVYVVDHRGTISNLADDILTEFNVANEIGNLGEIRAVTVDPSNQVWLGGNLGLAIGDILDSGNGPAQVSWDVLRPTSTQLGGRNPLPWRISVLDGDRNVWLATETSGLVRISPDQVTWTWFDQLVGCPLPDQSITGLHWDPRFTRSMWIGTPSNGIARVGLTAVPTTTERSIEAFPNPWHPAEHGGFVTFAGIPPDETTTLRIYNTAGELILEMTDVRGDKTWDGRNVRDVLVESGVYLVSATSTTGTRGTYEGKVAVLR